LATTEVSEMDKEREQMSELIFLNYESGKVKKHTKTNLLFIVCVSSKRDLSQ
jgi:hypothetical protein